MSQQKYLAITDNGETVYIEDSPRAVAHALVHVPSIKYYAILVDPETEIPTLSRARITNIDKLR